MAAPYTLLNAVSAATTGSGVEISGPFSVVVRGEMDGGTVIIEASIDDVEANYKPTGHELNLKDNGWKSVYLLGINYVRAKFVNPQNKVTPSVTVIANN